MQLQRPPIQHLATNVTCLLGELCLRVPLSLLISIFALQSIPALHLVIYKVLNIAAKEDWASAYRTMCSFITWVAFQDVLCDIFGKEAVLCTYLATVLPIAMCVFQVVFQVHCVFAMLVAKYAIV